MPRYSRLHNRFPQIIATLEPKTRAALAAGAQLIAETAEARAPVDEGDLRDAIHMEDTSEGVYVVAGGGPEDVFYGHMVEFGTSHSSARPFLIPALEERRAEVVATVAAALRSL
jgi:HK97 gp10 family phage protein